MNTLMTLALFCYFLAMLKFFLHLALKRRFFYVMAVLLSALGFAFHTAMLFAISAKTGHGPYTNPQEYASFFAWTTVAVMLAVIFLFRTATMGAFVAPLAFLLMVYSALLSEVSGAADQGVKNFWQTMHLTFSFLALSTFVIVFASSFMYLFQERQLKQRHVGSTFRMLPNLDTLDLVLHWALLIGFPLITVGVASGMFSTYSKYGDLLGPNLVRVLPLIFVWAVYGALMFGRTVVGWRGHKLAVMGAAGFLVACVGLAVHIL
ncbi:MAG: cytochrome c biogenesis protein CcsA [Nitrospinae bacterium]|nr:cytochrome c biogenesis protein CcsA [Nitrospinota bacterium]